MTEDLPVFLDRFPDLAAKEHACSIYLKSLEEDPDRYDGMDIRRFLLRLVDQGDRNLRMRAYTAALNSGNRAIWEMAARDEDATVRIWALKEGGRREQSRRQMTFFENGT